MAAAVSACIVSHQSVSTIDDCIASLQLSPAIQQIIVIDNASRDGTQEKVRDRAARDERVVLIENNRNEGFSFACNQAAEQAEKEHELLFINPDAMIAADQLGRLLELLSANPRVGVIGCVLRDSNGKVDSACRRRDPSLSRSFRSMLNLNAGLFVAEDRSTEPQLLDAISGALMLVRRKCHRAIGGFDERYWLHAEDLDFCRRSRAAGWQVGIANSVEAIHLRGVSSRKRPYRVAWQKHLSLWRYWRYWDGANRSLIVKAWAFALICAHCALQQTLIFIRRLSGTG